jgi:hypothetical protein
MANGACTIASIQWDFDMSCSVFPGTSFLYLRVPFFDSLSVSSYAFFSPMYFDDNFVHLIVVLLLKKTVESVVL